MADTIRAGYVRPTTQLTSFARAAAARRLRPGLAWTGYAASAWAALALPVHVYYGLGGTAGERLGGEALDRLGPGAAEFLWRAGHWATVLLVGLVALLALALVRPWGQVLPDWLPGIGGRRVPSWLLIVPSSAVAILTLAHAADALLRRAVGVTGSVFDGGLLDRSDGLTGVERGALDFLSWIGAHRTAYTFFDFALVGPWSLVLGVLLVLATLHYLGGPAARRIWLVVVALGVLRLLLAFNPSQALSWF